MCQIKNTHTLGSSGYSMERKVILSEIIFLVLKKIHNPFHEESLWQIQFSKLLEKKEGREENELKELPVVKNEKYINKTWRGFFLWILMIESIMMDVFDYCQ